MVIFLLYIISLIPLRILYIFSDITAYVLYHIFKYRRDIVYDNINQSFYFLTYRERILIEKQFYKNFCDTIFETIKGLSISEKNIQSNIQVDYSELEKILNKNENCNIYLGHQFNWEWANLHISSTFKDKKIIIVYKPISNNLINNLMLKIRSRFGSKMVSSTNFKKEMETFKNKQHILILVTDQNPLFSKKSFWTVFLSQRTAFISGSEKYTLKQKTPCLFANIIKEKRGFYRVELTPLLYFSEPYKIGKLTNLFVKKFDSEITKNPENYLWCQKKWKHKYKNEHQPNWIDF